MSTAESWVSSSGESASGRLVPPHPPRAPEGMTSLQKMKAMRVSAIAAYGQSAFDKDVIRGSFFLRSTFTLNTPEAIRHVLVDNYENYDRSPAGFRVLRPVLGKGLLTADGVRAWKHQRRTLSPAFTPRAVITLIPHMVAVIDETVARLSAASGAPVDLRAIMQDMTLEIAGRTMFSFGMDRHRATLRDFVVEYSAWLLRPHLLDLALPLSVPSPLDFPRARFSERWMRFVAMLVAARRATGKADGAPARDLFDLMDAARDPETGEAFSDAHLAEEVATMILAGHETSATVLFWVLYILALDPATQQRVAAEVRSASAGGEADLEDLKFTRAVIDETLRLYPPVFSIARSAHSADEIAGMPIKRGDVILIAPWLLHRREKLWPDPDAFIPERFMPPAAPPDRFAFLPFGAGPRTCIGAHFASVGATLALARIIGAFDVSLLDTSPVMPLGVVTTQPDRSPMFRIVPR